MKCYKLLSLMNIERVRQPSYSGWQAHRRCYPCTGERPHHRLRYFYWKHAGCCRLGYDIDSARNLYHIELQSKNIDKRRRFMDFFKQYTSNTLAGSSNQSYFLSDNTLQIGRVFYKVFAGGRYNYSFLALEMVLFLSYRIDADSKSFI